MTEATPPAPDRTDLWPLVHAERAALAADLTGLDDRVWSTPSLCAGLTVEDVLAHLTAGASLGPLRWFWGVLRCRFDFDRMVAQRLAQYRGPDGAATLEAFRGVVTSTTKAPIPVIAVLGEAVVHGEDIRRPLGITRDHPIDTLTRVVRYYAGSDQVVLGRGRIGGLRLEATDGPFAAGDGALVTGPTLALTMAMTGRAACCADLDGPGVETLRARGVPS